MEYNDLVALVQAQQQKIDELERLIHKDNFSNLRIFRTPVEFIQPNIYPLDDTDPTGGGGAATGRIPVKINGVIKYLPTTRKGRKQLYGAKS